MIKLVEESSQAESHHTSVTQRTTSLVGIATTVPKGGYGKTRKDVMGIVCEKGQRCSGRVSGGRWRIIRGSVVTSRRQHCQRQDGYCEPGNIGPLFLSPASDAGQTLTDL